jgi:hypothetical protein
VAITPNGPGLFQYEERLGDPDPFSNFLEAREKGSTTRNQLKLDGTDSPFWSRK